MSSASKVATVAVVSVMFGVAAASSEIRTPPPATENARAQRGRGSPSSSPSSLRVCADPNNLPFSNSRGEGFENALALLIAKDLGMTVSYTWWPQRRGFIRNTLNARTCDLVMGIPASFDLALATAPYYRTSYVFVTRRDRHLRLQSLDDPRLKTLRIGVHMIGDDYANVPPAQALAARGIVSNIRGYTIYGDYSKPDPPRDLIDAVARGEIDVAIAWGPLAGFFATREGVPLDLAPVHPQSEPNRPMVFDISMGVRRDSKDLKARLDNLIARRRADIDSLLRRYGVPLLPLISRPSSTPAPHDGATRARVRR